MHTKNEMLFFHPHDKYLKNLILFCVRGETVFLEENFLHSTQQKKFIRRCFDENCIEA